MSESLNSAGIFLINTLFDLYLLVLCVRLILAWSRANYFNPITRFIIQITQPIISPLRRFIPTYAGIEFATLLCIIGLEILKLILITSLFSNLPDVSVLLLVAVLSSIKLILATFFYAILIGAIMSFLTPGNTPLTQVISQIASPILHPLRRFIPPIGGFDITPIPALIILRLCIMLL